MLMVFTQKKFVRKAIDFLLDLLHCLFLIETPKLSGHWTIRIQFHLWLPLPNACNVDFIVQLFLLDYVFFFTL
jgi:hypothetical protein